MNLLLITLFSFLAATSLVIMIAMLITAVESTPQARIRRRLLAIGRNPSASGAEIQSLLKGPTYSQIPWLNVLLTRQTFVHSIDTLLERANVDMNVGVFVLLSLFSGGIVFLVMTILFNQGFFLSVIAGGLALITPYSYINYLCHKRLRRFLEQMPDGLDMVSQGLQAGLGLTQALVFVAKEMPDPMGTEFSVLMEEVNLGLPLVDALKNLQRRMPLPEVRLLSIALVVQREVGGSLAELLTKLADVIRDRFRIERQIKTLTAQNRLTAWVVCSIPPLVTVFMFTMDPQTMNEFWLTSVGKGMLFTALTLELLGILVFRKIIRIHI
jgi:tight adherence protein B